MALEASPDGPELLGLLGASGCGKSLTLKCIAGIERPDRGKITLDGQVLFDSDQGIDLPPQKRRVGYLFQNYALFPNMTVAQNILCGLRWQKDKAARREALAHMVSLLRLEGLEHRRPPPALRGPGPAGGPGAHPGQTAPGCSCWTSPSAPWTATCGTGSSWSCGSSWPAVGCRPSWSPTAGTRPTTCAHRIAVLDQGQLLAVKEKKALFADPGSIRAASLTGCKNIAPARKTGPCQVEVPDWGIRLDTAAPVGDGVKAVGIRAHYFNPKSPQNRAPRHLCPGDGGALRVDRGIPLRGSGPGEPAPLVAGPQGPPPRAIP